MALLFITPSSNESKVMAVEFAVQAAKAIKKKREVDKITLSEPLNVRPHTLLNTVSDAKTIAKDVMRSFQKSLIMNYEGIYTIGIQKGIILGSEPALIHAVAIQQYGGNTITAVSSSLPLSEKMKEVMLGEPNTKYQLFMKMFGEDVANKKIPLYEYLTGKKEYLWMQQTVQHALMPLYEKNKVYYK
jgi:non-canonical (house-cleaning) NTP pyrophosphatase